MAAILQPYVVPIITQDLDNQETLQDVFYSLERLSGTIDDIFLHIDKRLTDERSRLSKIHERVSTCQGKVKNVRGSNKATTVFSTAKFPAPKALPSYPTLFSSMSEMPPPYRDIIDDVRYLPANPKNSSIGDSDLSNDLQVIYGRLNSYATDIERVEFIMEDQGLGSMPLMIPSVGSMLLFNSDINPYQDYHTLDNLISSSGRIKIDEKEIAKQLASAPSTILSGDALPDIAALDLTFKPEMGEMTALALPSNLPLDFLADISYQGVSLPSIAPSHYGKANYTLPQITDGGMASGPSAKQTYQAPALSQSQSSRNASSSAPPPPPPGMSNNAPPPPPPPSMSNNAPPPPPSMNNAPPPPPQMMSSQNATSGSNSNNNDDDDEDEQQADTSNSGGGGGRSSLLDAIKGMNVNKLKKREEQNVAAAKRQREEVSTKPVSMMDEMRNRMQRRNEALSGKKDKDDQRRDSIIVQQAREKVAAATTTASSSSSIPKPPAPPARSSLFSVGFAPIEAESDEDEEPKMPAARFVANDSDDDSDVSEISFDDGPTNFATLPPKPVEPPKKVVPAPAPVSAPVTMPQAAVNTSVPAARRGSMLDESNVTIANMLTAIKGKQNDSSSDDEEWD